MSSGQFEVEVRRDHGVTVVCAHGELDFSCTSVFAARLRTAFDWDDGPVTIDLSDVRFMDSGGLATLLNAVRRLTRAGRTLNVVAPQGTAVRRMLWMTRLEETLRATETLDEAFQDHASRPAAAVRPEEPSQPRR